MLEVKNLSVHYGMIQAVRNVDFTVNEGEIVSLIGANGAGKSTILKTLSGLIHSSEGEIVYLGENIASTSAKKIVEKGLVQVPEGRHVFPGLTVKENLELGAFLRKDKEEIQKDMEAVFERFPILKERKDQDAQTLSGGEQQMLAMGRALMSRPKTIAPRRTFNGVSANLHPRDFQNHSRNPKDRDNGFTHRAKCENGIVDFKSCVCTRNRISGTERYRTRVVRK